MTCSFSALPIISSPSPAPLSTPSSNHSNAVSTWRSTSFIRRKLRTRSEVWQARKTMPTASTHVRRLQQYTDLMMAGELFATVTRSLVEMYPLPVRHARCRNNVLLGGEKKCASSSGGGKALMTSQPGQSVACAWNPLGCLTAAMQPRDHLLGYYLVLPAGHPATGWRLAERASECHSISSFFSVGNLNDAERRGWDGTDGACLAPLHRLAAECTYANARTGEWMSR